MRNQSWQERQESHDIENVLESLHVAGRRGSPSVSHRFARGRFPRRRTISIILLAAVTGTMMVFAGNALGEPEAPGDGGGTARDAEARDPDRNGERSAQAAPSPLAVPPSVITSPPTVAPAPPRPVRTAPPTPRPRPSRTSAPPPPPAPRPIRIDFADFDDVSGLALNGAAARSGSVLRLTSADGADAASAWSLTRIDPTKSFATTFRVLLHDIGADGFAFVLHNQGAGAIGGTGGGLGYGTDAVTGDRIPSSVAVEFDVFDNPWDPDTNDNHIEVTTNGFVTDGMALGVPDFRMWCDCEFNAWIDYDASTDRLRVYASKVDTKPSDPVVSAQVDLAGVAGRGPVYVGFTAGMGFFEADQDVLSWQLVQAR